MGLWMGISVITFAEFIQFFLQQAILTLSLANNFRRKSQDRISRMMSPQVELSGRVRNNTQNAEPRQNFSDQIYSRNDEKSPIKKFGLKRGFGSIFRTEKNDQKPQSSKRPTMCSTSQKKFESPFIRLGRYRKMVKTRKLTENRKNCSFRYTYTKPSPPLFRTSERKFSEIIINQSTSLYETRDIYEERTQDTEVRNPEFSDQVFRENDDTDLGDGLYGETLLERFQRGRNEKGKPDCRQSEIWWINFKINQL